MSVHMSLVDSAVSVASKQICHQMSCATSLLTLRSLSLSAFSRGLKLGAACSSSSSFLCQRRAFSSLYDGAHTRAAYTADRQELDQEGNARRELDMEAELAKLKAEERRNLQQHSQSPHSHQQHSQHPATSSSSSSHSTGAHTSAASGGSPSHYSSLSDAELLTELNSGKLKFFNLENELGDLERAVRLRRLFVESNTGTALTHLPYQHYDYSKVQGQCCENVIGHVPLPVGVAGPLQVDGKMVWLPMATTEGALVASTSRGCRALTAAGGVHTEILRDGMTRAPVVACPSASYAATIKRFLDENFSAVSAVFAETSRFARLKSADAIIAGRYLFIRFEGVTGDAMGMNMIGKASEKSMAFLLEKFPEAKLLSLSGNLCVDKKPSAINWIRGRGKSVVAEAVIPADIVGAVLKTKVSALVELNQAKNMIGSALAGTIGGYNAHAANMVAAIFLATGQDPAQVVESANCMTLMESRPRRKENGDTVEDLYVSVTMPTIEVGTVGGGTSLPAQRSMLELVGVAGSSSTQPSGSHARQLARVVASGVLAGELSLMSALSSGDLIKSHLKLNRKPASPAAHSKH